MSEPNSFAAAGDQSTQPSNQQKKTQFHLQANADVLDRVIPQIRRYFATVNQPGAGFHIGISEPPHGRSDDVYVRHIHIWKNLPDVDEAPEYRLQATTTYAPDDKINGYARITVAIRNQPPKGEPTPAAVYHFLRGGKDLVSVDKQNKIIAPIQGQSVNEITFKARELLDEWVKVLYRPRPASNQSPRALAP